MDNKSIFVKKIKNYASWRVLKMRKNIMNITNRVPITRTKFLLFRTFNHTVLFFYVFLSLAPCDRKKNIK